MTRLDSEEERQRLARRYAGMSDEELQAVARDAADLTQTAQSALQQEMARRGAAGVPQPPPDVEAEAEAEDPAKAGLLADPGADEIDLQAWTMVRRFRDLPEALLAKGALESAGIECHLTDDNMVRLDWFISNLLGGAKLMVRPEDAEAAREVLDQPVPESFEVEGAGQYRQPECPKCHSVNITFEGLNKPVAYATAFFGVPLPIPRNSWKCEACGCRWKETEDSGS